MRLLYPHTCKKKTRFFVLIFPPLLWSVRSQSVTLFQCWAYSGAVRTCVVLCWCWFVESCCWKYSCTSIDRAALFVVRKNVECLKDFPSKKEENWNSCNHVIDCPTPVLYIRHSYIISVLIGHLSLLARADVRRCTLCTRQILSRLLQCTFDCWVAVFKQVLLRKSRHLRGKKTKYRTSFCLHPSCCRSTPWAKQSSQGSRIRVRYNRIRYRTYVSFEK